MATRKRLSLICEIPNFANAYVGKVTKFQGYRLFRFGVLSNLLAWNRVKKSYITSLVHSFTPYGLGNILLF